MIPKNIKYNESIFHNEISERVDKDNIKGGDKNINYEENDF